MHWPLREEGNSFRAAHGRFRGFAGVKRPRLAEKPKSNRKKKKESHRKQTALWQNYGMSYVQEKYRGSGASSRGDVQKIGEISGVGVVGGATQVFLSKASPSVNNGQQSASTKIDVHSVNSIGLSDRFTDLPDGHVQMFKFDTLILHAVPTAAVHTTVTTYLVRVSTAAPALHTSNWTSIFLFE